MRLIPKKVYTWDPEQGAKSITVPAGNLVNCSLHPTKPKLECHVEHIVISFSLVGLDEFNVFGLRWNPDGKTICLLGKTKLCCYQFVDLSSANLSEC
jgi:hypothetical protein